MSEESPAYEEEELLGFLTSTVYSGNTMSYLTETAAGLILKQQYPLH